MGANFSVADLEEATHEWPLQVKSDPCQLPSRMGILLLGIYPEKTVIQKDTCTPVFTAALFTIARSWKQPK